MREDVSRFGALLQASQGDTEPGQLLNLADRESSLPRLWRGFMAARILVAIILLILLLYLRVMGQAPHPIAFVICLSYLVLTVWVRVLGRPSLPGARFDPQWLVTVGADVAVFGALLFLQVATINYTPLFALPVLLAAVLGPLPLALGTAAAVSVALLLDALQYTLAGATDAVARYVQAALTGTGLFAVAYLANQLSTRLIKQEKVARGSEMAARAQIQVNQLVIENLSDGVLVIDANGIVHAANPAAREMLGSGSAQVLGGSVPELPQPPFVLAARTAWQPLADLAASSLRRQDALTREIAVVDAEGAERRLHVKTYISGDGIHPAQDLAGLCVMFLEDLREMEARVRTEKLAAMGRMSAAVAHEIRNPLSAIAQANALLAEEITQPQQQSLVRMVAQNVRRLSRVIDDVLDVSRAEGSAKEQALLGDVAAFVNSVCDDWSVQHSAGNVLLAPINTTQFAIKFEADHLRRVLVNLLDNALRHASRRHGAIQVELQQTTSKAQLLQLSVWSDGAPIEHGVQRHLFEPFFSSQSRSSGLGLYICRELCARHGAHIGYQRSWRRLPPGQGVDGCEGNLFHVELQLTAEAAPHLSVPMSLPPRIGA
jgi:two-component system, NtrC family, sensor histidine kinase PilS